MDGLNRLHIGDSGYIILRKSGSEFKILYESEEMVHGFNFPYQVGTSGDNPYSASIRAHSVEIGDLIVLATDGLWDNLSKIDIIKIITEYSNSLQPSEKINLTELATKISTKSREIALREDIDTPFSIRAKQNNIDFPGGKLDDVTVILAEIIESKKAVNSGRKSDL